MNDSIWVFVPITALLSVALVVVMAIVLRSRRHAQEREMLNRERMSALEKGINLPILEAPKNQSAPTALQSGLVCIAVGLGLAIFFNEVASQLIGIGVLVMLIGVANLVYWQLAGKKEWDARVQWQQSVGEAYLHYLAQLSAQLKSAPAGKGGLPDGQ